MRCLLIDQNADESRRIQGLLLSLGISCECVSDVSAVMPAESQVVLMEASSLGKAQVLLRDFGRHGTKVICYAEAPAADDMAASILAGAADFLVKPFDRALLRFKLEQAGLLPQ